VLRYASKALLLREGLVRRGEHQQEAGPGTAAGLSAACLGGRSESLCKPSLAPLSFWCCRLALEATGLEPLFQAIGLDTDAPSLQRAMHWLKQQGADKVADLNQLPPGTYSCRELAESLGLPLLKAQRLLSALEGTQA